MANVERFSKEEFEAALPKASDGTPLWEYFGVYKGEHCYTMPVPNTNKRIFIRSSVKRNGMSAVSGEDSIRCRVEYWYEKAGKWLSLKNTGTSKELSRWTTRVTGWEGRMVDKLRELWALAVEDSKGKTERTERNDTLGTDESKQKTTSNEGTKQDSSVPREGEGKDSTGEGTTPATSDQDVPSPSRSPVSLGKAVKVSENDGSEEEDQRQPRREPNERQREAIEAPIDKSVRVLAPPGAGKTFVISERYAYLLENGAQPKDILAVTFSKSMADELRDRILAVSPQARGTEAEKQVCTIHALCYRMLKDGGDRRTVAKEWQIKKNMEEIAIEIWQYSDDRPGWKEVIAWVNAVKGKGIASINDLEFFIRCLGEYHGRKVHEARRKFDERMKGQQLITFADMLFDVEQKMARELPFRTRWQNRISWVICDEGQDTSAQAMRILTTLAEPQKRFFIVGDSDQLLYRFAGSTPEVNLFEGFEERYPDGVTVKLAINYRSTRTIIKTCKELIKFNYTRHGGPYDEGYVKDVQAREGTDEGSPVTFNEYDDAGDEADALIESLVERFANGYQPGDVFVGARTRAQLGYLEGPLVRANIPFVNICGGSFWGSKHVEDIIAYLRLAVDNGDDDAFEKVYNIASNWNVHPWGDQKGEYCSHRYLGRAFLDACDGSYKNVWTAVGRRHSFEPGVKDLTEFVQEIEYNLAQESSLGKVLRMIIEDCYKKYLAKDEGITISDDAENGKLEDLETVIEIAEGFNKVEEFLGYVKEAVKAEHKAEQDAKEKNTDEYVVISTVHRLKGLERKVVYGIGMSENGNETNPKSILPHTFSLAEPPQNGVLPTGGKGKVEDERCIAFVLVSRAKEECHLSGVREYRKEIMVPSRFVEEMGLVEERNDHGCDGL